MKKFLVLFIALLGLTNISNAQKKDLPELQREPYGVFDFQYGYTSKIETFITNYGINFYHVPQAKAGLFWPRGIKNQYVSASGFWFGAKKRNPSNLSEYNKLALISYNPNSGKGWFVPGRIEDGDTLRDDLSNKYRAYFSSDFFKETGAPFKGDDGPNWPLWIADGELRYEGGTLKNDYIHSESNRNRDFRTNGPLFVSDDDIVTTFKDTDLRFYEGGIENRKAQGYPMKIQTTSSIYTWGNGNMNDIIIINYLLENKSSDTLKECWFGSVNDIDIALYNELPGNKKLVTNDRLKYFQEDSTLNLAVGWTDTDGGELGKGFGYIGFSMLETPAVNSAEYIRTDKLIFEPYEQLGLKTFKNWNIEEDAQTDIERYDLIAASTLDGDTGPGDKRLMIGTGPFNMLPNAKARVAILIALAMPAKGGEADGTLEDIAGIPGKTTKGDNPEILADKNSLIDKIKRTYTKYYNNMLMTVRDAEPSTFNASVYPNPVDDITTFEYTLNKSSKIRISIIDAMGKEIGEVFNGVKPEGNYHHFIDFSSYNLTNGMYFIKLQSDSDVATKKIVIMK